MTRAWRIPWEGGLCSASPCRRTGRLLWSACTDTRALTREIYRQVPLQSSGPVLGKPVEHTHKNIGVKVWKSLGNLDFYSIGKYLDIQFKMSYSPLKTKVAQSYFLCWNKALYKKVPKYPKPSTLINLTYLFIFQTVKKDEFSTKCNQTDHHRMPGGRQEVRLPFLSSSAPIIAVLYPTEAPTGGAWFGSTLAHFTLLGHLNLLQMGLDGKVVT